MLVSWPVRSLPLESKKRMAISRAMRRRLRRSLIALRTKFKRDGLVAFSVVSVCGLLCGDSGEASGEDSDEDGGEDEGKDADAVFDGAVCAVSTVSTVPTVVSAITGEGEEAFVIHPIYCVGRFLIRFCVRCTLRLSPSVA